MTKESLYDEFVERMGIDGSRDGGMAECPAHADEKPSLSYRRNSGGGLSDLELNCHAGCDWVDVLRELDLATTYDYEDESGGLVAQMVRLRPKTFFARSPNGEGWSYNWPEETRVLYRLPEVLASRRVILVEGEKDADRVRDLGIENAAATTCPFGAEAWRDEYSEDLRDCRVAIIPDNDEAGRKHAKRVAGCLHGIAKNVRVIELPGLGVGEDISDWLDSDHSKDDLLELIKRTLEWQPPEEEPRRRREGGGRPLAMPKVRKLVRRAVKKMKARRETIATLWAILSHVDRDTMECWPSQDTLGRLTARSKRSIQRDVASLQRRGVLRATDRRPGSTLYRILLGDEPPVR